MTLASPRYGKNVYIKAKVPFFLLSGNKTLLETMVAGTRNRR